MRHNRNDKDQKEETKNIPFNVEIPTVEGENQPTEEGQFILLQDQLNAAILRLNEADDSFLRLRAEFDNFRKRIRQEQLEDKQRGIEEFVLQLLPIMDNFERAVGAADKTKNFDTMSEGVSMIVQQMHALFDKYAIKPIQAAGQPFDPVFHDAIMRVDNPDLPDNTVVNEAEKGYTMRGRVIRPSRVMVAKRPQDGE
ncbi:MAG: nucleotide exchange factor GrpE [bacterium]|jgi:molecular chaperone GrpE